MEPVSLAASIVTLTDTGFSVGKLLLDTYSSYRNAPQEVLEIAHEVNICCSLMASMGEQLRTCSVQYSAEFQQSVAWLLQNVGTILL